MMSALECHLKAAHCEEMSRNCANPVDRSMLLEVATLWRKLAGMPPIQHRHAVAEAL